MYATLFNRRRLLKSHNGHSNAYYRLRERYDYYTSRVAQRSMQNLHGVFVPWVG